MAVERAVIDETNQVMRDPASQLGKEIIERQSKEANERLNRLTLHLTPRMQELDAASILAAMNRGEADAKQSGSQSWELITSCGKKCGGGGATGGEQEKANQCNQSCINADPLMARIQSCGNVNWLPF